MLAARRQPSGTDSIRESNRSSTLAALILGKVLDQIPLFQHSFDAPGSPASSARGGFTE
jgi:hypothetical protein